MLVSGKSIKEDMSVDAEVCIVGGGVAGIVLANELKKSFANIVVVESGGEHYDQAAQELCQPDDKPSLLPDPNYSRLRFLGGSSNHWENNTSPYSPIDFETRGWIANSGWPISYQDIQAYYVKAQLYCGVDSDGYSSEYWQAKLAQNDLVSESKLIETQITKAAIPPVRFFDRHGKSLLQGQQVTVYTHADLKDLEYTPSKQTVQRATFNTQGAAELTISAKVFVMCMGGIENARMLLYFNQKYDDQLGNQSGKVGKYFMEHPTPRAAHIMTDVPETFDLYKMSMVDSRGIVGFFSLTEHALRQEQTTNLRIPLIPNTKFHMSEGISSSHILRNSLSQGELPDEWGHHIANVLSDLDMVVEGIARKKFDKKVFEDADKIAGFTSPMMMEQTPEERNQIRLGTSKDRNGIPRVTIDYRVSDDDKNRVWKSLKVVSKELNLYNIGRLRMLKHRADRLWGDQLGFSNHHMGTTRMSENPDTGVVDKQQRVFGTDNLFVAGSSVFCTGGHVPPTLTICATTVRLAEYLSKEYASV